MQTEAWVVFQILQAWGAHPRLRLARTNTGAAKIKGRLVRFNPRGLGDISGLIAPWGRFITIECKTQTGKQRADQKTMQAAIEAMGGLYVLARSLSDMDTAMAKLGIFR